ncbi:uncharacterized protein PITG_20210 [Phytophthora infestans T30-4]|uniref:Uncharacterized protein n=1 Tax=Phytophthora infestans (strain T30-4) TaxID=403677 RepID=D0P1I4_PHYIT|nr:uncharacterized protein PITG_20210 [Phytophthora infestans T30-4]EEY54607.1 hypothetical protein PITG_20210 [Phytophthora infestans T30-4]|eukprot:XP_002895844.1 hypothetical protein PITG_20210 [Phytophthora infestans T30-4]
MAIVACGCRGHSPPDTVQRRRKFDPHIDSPARRKSMEDHSDMITMLAASQAVTHSANLASKARWRRQLRSEEEAPSKSHFETAYCAARKSNG